MCDPVQDFVEFSGSFVNSLLPDMMSEVRRRVAFTAVCLIKSGTTGKPGLTSACLLLAGSIFKPHWN